MGEIRSILNSTRRLWFLLLLLSCASPESTTSRNPDRPGPEPRPQTQSSLAVTCHAQLKHRGTVLRAFGDCALPDGTLLKIDLFEFPERSLGKQITAQRFNAASRQLYLSGGAYSYEFTVAAPGAFELTFSVPDSLQEKDLLPEIRKKVGPANEWTFRFPLWDEGFIGELAPSMKQVLAEARAARDFFERCEKAGATEASWAAGKGRLLHEGEELQMKLLEGRTFAIYPASLLALMSKLRLMTHPPKRGDGEAIWKRIQEPFDESLSGRELSLWLLKDLRRTDGKRSAEWEAMLASHKDAPGVREWVASLKVAAGSGIDVLESQVRGLAIVAPKPSEK